MGPTGQPPLSKQARMLKYLVEEGRGTRLCVYACVCVCVCVYVSSLAAKKASGRSSAWLD